MKLLDRSHKHLEDPAEDVSARCDPAYVARVVSAMVGDWSRLGSVLNWECCGRSTEESFCINVH